MVEPDGLATSDPLGIGGLLIDAARLEQLARQGADVPDGLIAELLRAAREGLGAARLDLEAPAARRLAFRELGLAIGLHAVERMAQDDALAGGDAVRAEVEALKRYVPLAARIERFWLDPTHQAVPSFTEHRDINEVMLATSLAPRGCLDLPRPPAEE